MQDVVWELTTPPPCAALRRSVAALPSKSCESVSFVLIGYITIE
jgi:hypothetical protein